MADIEKTLELAVSDKKLSTELAVVQKKIEIFGKENVELCKLVETQIVKTQKQYQEEAVQLYKEQNEEKKLSDKESGEAREAIAKKYGEKLKSIASDTVKAIGSGMAEAKDAAVQIGTAAIDSALSMDKAMSQFAASTGKCTEETERYEKVMENIYSNNYGDSFDDIGQAMAEVTNRLGDLDDASLQNLTESAFALRDTFGYDIAESAKAARTLMEEFGISGEEAMNLIAAGALNGLDSSGELMDGIIGCSDQMLTELAGIEEGAYNTADAMEQIKEVKYDDVGSMFDGLRRSVEVMLIPLGEQLIPLISELAEEVLPSLMSVIEEILPVLLELFEAIVPLVGEFVQAVLPVLVELFDALLPPLMEIIQALLPPLLELVNALLPIIQAVLKLLQPIIEVIADIAGTIADVISNALIPLVSALDPIISVITSLLMPCLRGLLTVFHTVFDGIVSTISEKVGSIADTLNNLIDFVANIFTGNWEGAWNNIKNILGNIVSGFTDIVKAPINGMISLLNGFIKAINRIKIPSWVPGVGGKGINIPTIPRLKIGMDYVPSDFFPAFLDEGEAVLTKQENQLYRGIGGIDGITRIMSLGSMLGQMRTAEKMMIDYDKFKSIFSDSLKEMDLTVEMSGEKVGKLITPSVDHHLSESEDMRRRGC